MGKHWYQSNRNESLYCRQVSLIMPQGTPITRGALTFLAAVVLFDAIPTGWVSNISQRQNFFVDFLLQRRLVLKNHKSLR